MTFQSEVGSLRRVVLKHARDALVSPTRAEVQWKSMDWLAPPLFDAALRESDAFAALLESLGVHVEWMPAADVGIDSLYARDPAVVCDGGVIVGRMGKKARRREPAALAAALSRLGHPILGRIEAPGTLEGGDTTWIGPRSLAVGLGARTNREGIEQLQALIPDVDVIAVPLPNRHFPGDVFHLMSVLSPLAPDLALVHAQLLPVPFQRDLRSRGFELVNVPASEFGSQGPNVLAVAPRVAVALEGNPETKRLMEAAGVEVFTYRGDEISRKGFGGPTCLTRPLERGG